MLRNKALTTRSNAPLDMSKTFDRFWHEVLIYKLKPREVSHNLLTLFKFFWTIVIKEFYLMVKVPIGELIKEGVLQGSILGSLL